MALRLAPIVVLLAMPAVTVAEPARVAANDAKPDCGQQPTCVAEKFADALSSRNGQALRVEGLVTFKPGSSRVYSDSREKLQKLAAAWRTHARWSTISVAGYAGRGHSAELAQQRADKIRGYLVRYGVSPQFVVAFAAAELADEPVDAAGTGRVDLAIDVCERGPKDCPRAGGSAAKPGH